jgi:hypothetical protein
LSVIARRTMSSTAVARTCERREPFDTYALIRQPYFRKETGDVRHVGQLASISLIKAISMACVGTHCISRECASRGECTDSWTTLKCVNGTIVIGKDERCSDESAHHLRENIDWYLPPRKSAPRLFAQSSRQIVLMPGWINSQQRPKLSATLDVRIGMSKRYLDHSPQD